MSWYYGVPGMLLELPDSSPNISASVDRGVEEMTGGAGGRTVFKRAALREWEFEHEYLPPVLARHLDALDEGHYGRARKVLITGQIENLLGPNQSSGGTRYGTTTGFSIGSAFNEINYTSGITRGYFGSIQVGIAPGFTPGSAISFTWFPGTPGIPALANMYYAFSGYLAGDYGTEAAHLAITWLDSTGAAISTSSWDSQDLPDVNDGEWLWSNMVAKAPEGTVWMVPKWIVDAGTDYVYGTEFDLRLADQCDVWLPGRGVPCVEVWDKPNEYPLYGYQSFSLTLKEVGEGAVY